LPHILVNFCSFLLKFFQNIRGILQKFSQKSLKISLENLKQKDLGQALGLFRSFNFYHKGEVRN